MMRLLPAAAAVLVALAGCSSDDGSPTRTGGSSPAGSPAGSSAPTVAGGPSSGDAAAGPADGGSYASAADLVAALAAIGAGCEEPQTGSYPEVSDAQSCIYDGSEDVIALVFADAAEKENYLVNKPELASAVVGQDWAVETVLPATAEQIAGELGGEVMAGQTG